MDIKETSAMTEASGLTGDQDGTRQASTKSDLAGQASRRSPLQNGDAVAERLREMTVKAPLQSLCVAFLLGVWVARRR
ncbi:hypothetical protein [Bradyrhizobium sp. McL0616]|uniref:hypothetical protein n=1 Tax=Bradyrhizobium sp. McL0616 TaxID=3415674 RepID=UPI003CF77B16